MTGSARFAAACGVLSRYVKAAAMEADAWPAAMAALPLMPGADVSTTTREEQETCAPQMTIFYGGRVLVLDDVPVGRAAEVLRLAAAAREAPRGHGRHAGDDLPVARKASLQRFMENRRGRVAARETPYNRPDAADGACRDDRLTLSL